MVETGGSGGIAVSSDLRTSTKPDSLNRLPRTAIYGPLELKGYSKTPNIETFI